MIEELTPEQEVLLDEYQQKAWDAGTTTGPLPEKKRVKEITNNLQDLLGRPHTDNVVVFPNPIQCYVACCWWEMEPTQTNKKMPKVISDILDTMSEQLGDAMPDKQVDVDELVGYMENPAASWLAGSMEAGIFYFYKFMIDELGLKVDKELLSKYHKWEATIDLGMVYPLDDFVAVSERPAEVHSENFRLHRDGGPALVYKGEPELKVWSLNGVRVPQYLAETPAMELDIDWYNRQTNADIKAEFVRKYGIERLLEKGTRIDGYENYPDEEWYQKSEYELYDMACFFEGIDYAPHLKMTNQTAGIFHVEAVGPNCRTVADAVEDRLGGRDLQIVDIK